MPPPVTRKVPAEGRVRHADPAVTVPKSSDQSPPGVWGWLLGKPLTSKEEHWPELHVAFVTRSVTEGGGSGSVADVQANTTRRAGRVEVFSSLWKRRPQRLVLTIYMVTPRGGGGGEDLLLPTQKRTSGPTCDTTT